VHSARARRRVLHSRVLAFGAAVALASPAAPATAVTSCHALPPVGDVLAEDDRMRSVRGFEEERELRDFALFWYRNVANDLANGHGDSIEVFAHAFRPACADRVVVVRWLRDLLLAPGTATDFSRRVAMGRRLAIGRASQAGPTW
jgi:hypothetical protein